MELASVSSWRDDANVSDGLLRWASDYVGMPSSEVTATSRHMNNEVVVHFEAKTGTENKKPVQDLKHVQSLMPEVLAPFDLKVLNADAPSTAFCYSYSDEPTSKEFLTLEIPSEDSSDWSEDNVEQSSVLK